MTDGRVEQGGLIVSTRRFVSMMFFFTHAERVQALTRTQYQNKHLAFSTRDLLEMMVLWILNNINLDI